MENRTKQLIKMANPSLTASAGERHLYKIIKSLRQLNRDSIRYRFEREEIIDLVEHILFDEET